MTTTARPGPEASHDRRGGLTGVKTGLLAGPMVFGVSAGSLALPDAAVGLSVPPAATAWLLGAYALTQGTGTALFGRLSDARGVPRTLLFGAVLLSAGAVLCLAADSLLLMIAGRLTLGTGAGAMTAAALSIAAQSTDVDRNRTLTAMAATMAVFVGSGTAIGGVVTTALSWRATLVLPLLCLAGAVLCRRLATTHSVGSGVAVDGIGAGLLIVTSGGALTLIQARTLGLPVAATGVVAGVAMGTAVLLVWWTRRHPTGFVPRAVTGLSTFRSAAVVGAGTFGGLYAVLFAVPQILVRQHGWTPLIAGLALLGPAALGALLSRCAGPLASHVGHGRILTVVCALFAAATAAIGLSGGAIPVLVVGTTLSLVGFGVTQSLLVAQVSAAVPAPARGTATGLLQLAHVTGGAVGSAAAGALTLALRPADALAALTLLPLGAAVVAAWSSLRGTRS